MLLFYVSVSDYVVCAFYVHLHILSSDNIVVLSCSVVLSRTVAMSVSRGSEPRLAMKLFLE